LPFGRAVRSIGQDPHAQAGAVVARVCGVRRSGYGLAGTGEAKRRLVDGVSTLGVLHVPNAFAHDRGRIEAMTSFAGVVQATNSSKQSFHSLHRSSLPSRSSLARAAYRARS